MTLVNTASLRTFRRHGGQAGDGISILQRMIVAVLMAVALCVFIAAPAHAQSTADFLDEDILGPHDSRIPGDMVVNSWRWYGIDVLPQLVIMAAETSLGDPNLGGTLVYKNNFGCMRYHGPDTKWGVLSTGRAWVAGKDWYAFPSPEVGVMALGRYLKVGADGRYRKALSGPPYDWQGFAAVYYGRNVSGYRSYVQRLYRLERQYRTVAAQNGFVW